MLCNMCEYTPDVFSVKTFCHVCTTLYARCAYTADSTLCNMCDSTPDIAKFEECVYTADSTLCNMCKSTPDVSMCEDNLKMLLEGRAWQLFKRLPLGLQAF